MTLAQAPGHRPQRRDHRERRRDKGERKYRRKDGSRGRRGERDRGPLRSGKRCAARGATSPNARKAKPCAREASWRRRGLPALAAAGVGRKRPASSWSDGTFLRLQTRSSRPTSINSWRSCIPTTGAGEKNMDGALHEDKPYEFEAPNSTSGWRTARSVPPSRGLFDEERSRADDRHRPRRHRAKGPRRNCESEERFRSAFGDAPRRRGPRGPGRASPQGKPGSVRDARLLGGGAAGQGLCRLSIPTTARSVRITCGGCWRKGKATRWRGATRAPTGMRCGI